MSLVSQVVSLASRVAAEFKARDLTNQAALALKAPLASPAFTGVPALAGSPLMSINSYGQAYVGSSVNSAGTMANWWTKVLSIRLTGQYADATEVIRLIGSGSGAAVAASANIVVRLKQQNPLAGVPVYSLYISDFIGGITPSRLSFVITANSATETIGELWAQAGAGGWETYSYQELISSKSGGVVTWAFNAPMQTALPAGTAIIASEYPVPANTAPINNPTFTGTVGGITATMVGLGSVNNTADSAKPVSTAQATADALKLNANDASVTNSRPPNGAAGGDLSGTYPNPTVAKLNAVAAPVSAPVAGMILAATSPTASSWQTQAAVASPFIDVTKSPYTAVGDGTTDDSAAINAAISGNPGRTVYIPNNSAGNRVYAVTSVTGIVMGTPGVKLVIDQGVTIKMLLSNIAQYAIVKVTAADCSIEGGTLLGDGPAHYAAGYAAGEWGHCLVVEITAHRFSATKVTCRNGYGDGIYIGGAGVGEAYDVTITNCICDDNRRNGMSVTSARRLKVIGGSYINTGQNNYTAPGAGIDIEPNPSGNYCTDIIIMGVNFEQNKSYGLMTVGATGVSCEVTALGCVARNNGFNGSAAGFHTTHALNSTRYIGCMALGNTNGGFYILSDRTQLHECSATGNAGIGFDFANSATDSSMFGCSAFSNGAQGIRIGTSAVVMAMTISGGIIRGNGTTTNNTYHNIEIYGSNVTISGVHSEAGANTNKPARAWEIRAGTTNVQVLGCSSRGAFGGALWADDSGVAMFYPQPGLTKRTGTPAAATDLATTLTLVNNLRLSLINLGWIA